MKSPCEAASANFGFNPLAFNIEEYILKEQKIFTEKQLSSVSTPVDPPVIELLVLKHLIHQGCEKTTIAFYRSTFSPFSECPLSEADILNVLDRAKLRKRLVDMVMVGDIEELFSSLPSTYPQLLQSNLELDFVLTCRLFVETILKTSTDDHEGFNRIIAIGQSIENKFSLYQIHHLQSLARDTLALVAYKNRNLSPSAYLLSEGHRSLVASQLSSALLKMDHLSPYSDLERLIRAYQTNTDYLKDLGVVEAALAEPIPTIMRSQSIKPE